MLKSDLPGLPTSTVRFDDNRTTDPAIYSALPAATALAQAHWKL